MGEGSITRSVIGCLQPGHSTTGMLGGVIGNLPEPGDIGRFSRGPYRRYARFHDAYTQEECLPPRPPLDAACRGPSGAASSRCPGQSKTLTAAIRRLPAFSGNLGYPSVHPDISDV